MIERKKVLVIIPAFNEEHSIASVIEELKQCQDRLDMVVVNDGSTDQTEKIVRCLGVEVINLPVNLGIGGAVQTGFRYAVENDYDIAIQVDGDGQHDPQEIKKLLKPIYDNQGDVVIGSRFVEQKGYQSSLPRQLGIRVLRTVIFLLTGKYITDPTSGFRAYRKKVFSLLAGDYSEDYPEPECLILLNKYKVSIVEVPVSMRERCKGNSSISAFLAIIYMLKVCFGMLISKMRVKNYEY